MSIPPYPEANSFGPRDGQPTGTRVTIKYIWPKRIAVILAGLAVVGGIGFGAKTLLQSDDPARITAIRFGQMYLIGARVPVG